MFFSKVGFIIVPIATTISSWFNGIILLVFVINKNYFKFRWEVEKFLDSGPLKNCWLTTVVSQPIPMGSST